MFHLFLLALLFSSQSIPTQSPSEGLSRPEIYSLVDSGKLAAAEQMVRAYLGAHEQSADAHYLLGYVLFKKHEARASLAEYTIAARYRTPGSYDFETVASDYILLKDYPDADKWFSKSVEMDPNNLSALYYLGRTKYNENRFEESISAFQQCLKRDPKNVKYLDNLGLAYQGLGKNTDAETSFRSALAEDGTATVHDSGPYLDLGSLLIDTDRALDSIPFLIQATQISPDDLRARTQLGKAYLKMDQLEKAQKELETAVTANPKNAPTHFLLAQVYRKRGFLDKARHESETYTTLNRDHSTSE